MAGEIRRMLVKIAHETQDGDGCIRIFVDHTPTTTLCCFKLNLELRGGPSNGQFIGISAKSIIEREHSRSITYNFASLQDAVKRVILPRHTQQCNDFPI